MSTSTPEEDDEGDKVLRRTHSLLSPGRVGATLEEADLPVSLDAAGARAGYGLRSHNGLVAGVYVFSDWQGAERAVNELASKLSAASDERVETLQNGPAVLLVSAPVGGGSENLLVNVMSAFAGDE